MLFPAMTLTPLCPAATIGKIHAPEPTAQFLDSQGAMIHGRNRPQFSHVKSSLKTSIGSCITIDFTPSRAHFPWTPVFDLKVSDQAEYLTNYAISFSLQIS